MLKNPPPLPPCPKARFQREFSIANIITLFHNMQQFFKFFSFCHVNIANTSITDSTFASTNPNYIIV